MSKASETGGDPSNGRQFVDGAHDRELARAAALESEGDYRELEVCCRRLLASVPEDPRPNRLLGVALYCLGRPGEALAPLQRALAAAPADASTRAKLADALVALGRIEEAVEHCRVLAAAEPGNLLWSCNLAALLGRAGRHIDVIRELDRALQIDPGCIPALYNQAQSLLALGQAHAAVERLSVCARLAPQEPEVLTSLGLALSEIAHLDAAHNVYDHVLATAPDHVRALESRGLLRMVLGRYEDALGDFDRLLAIEPGASSALERRHLALRRLGRFEEALECARQLTRCDPRPSGAASIYHVAAQEVTDWSDYEVRIEAVLQDVRAGRRASPHAFLNVADSPSDQLRCAATFARSFGQFEPLWRGERYKHSRLKIGYLSSDLHNHATAQLMAGIFERHDRGQFECYALDYGTAGDDPMRLRLKSAFEHFEELGAAPAAEIARHVRALEIDVLVDLKGYTAGSRVEALARRPAPLQLHYLGYPGTLGAPWVDYLVADRVVVPPELTAHYAERIVWMPHCYQANDDRRGIHPIELQRRDAGLPEQAVVLCAMHHSYKLNPGLFDVWMRLLARLPHATLWLLEHGEANDARLVSEAAARGIGPERLVFGPRLPQGQHLARLRLADLYLDTWPISAHTTAGDALWAGLPMVAFEGRGFAARVSASVLKAAGFNDLVTRTPAEYEALTFNLASRPDQLAQLRRRIATARASALFDTAGVTRALEAAYLVISERHSSGLPPASLSIDAK